MSTAIVMSEAKLALVKAEADLRKAQAEVAKEQREEDKESLRNANVAGRAATEEYSTLRAEFEKAEKQLELLQSKLDAANVNILQHDRLKPEALSFPTDVERATWKREHSQLIEKRDRLLKDARDKDFNTQQARRAAITAAGRVDQLMQVVRNLENKLSDPDFFGRGWVGGVSQVR